jgi:hypothetical protein
MPGIHVLEIPEEQSTPRVASLGRHVNLVEPVQKFHVLFLNIYQTS